MNNLYSFFENAFNDNKLVQSYLIGNTKFDDIKEELYKVLSSFFFKNSTNLDENPDLYIYKNDEENISKDDIVELIKNVNTTSQFNNMKVYIIDECEKLNEYSYNSLLKTLEEPNMNVYAFLITRNIDLVKPTISSRCQKIFISSEVKENSTNEEINIITNNLIKIIEDDQLKTISSHPELYVKISDRELFQNVLICMQQKYMDKLNEIIDDNYNSDLVENISKKVLIINNNINLLNNNLNKNLSIDRFVIEMWRCNNENS